MITFAEPMETMSLDGGLLMYTKNPKPFGEWDRYNDCPSPSGRVVKFINDNGTDSNLEDAQEYFEYGDLLVVKEIYVGRSSSHVEFFGFPDIKFNTAHFVDNF